MIKKTKQEKCIVCRKALKNDKQFDELEGGATFQVSFGYPTLLDGIVFAGAICVKCGDALANQGLLKVIHNEFGESKRYEPLSK